MLRVVVQVAILSKALSTLQSKMLNKLGVQRAAVGTDVERFVFYPHEPKDYTLLKNFGSLGSVDTLDKLRRKIDESTISARIKDPTSNIIFHTMTQA